MTETGRRRAGWMMFDWASQPFYTLLLTFVFGPYFAGAAAAHLSAQGLAGDAAGARAQSLWSLGQAGAGILVALSAPLLGALADGAGRRLPWIAAFSALYVLGAAGLWILGPGGANLHLALASFAIALIGAEFATIFVNALLPSLGAGGAVGRLSGSGFALGYAGGVLSLLVVLALLVETETGRTMAGLAPAFGLDPEAREGTRAVGPFVALWYLVFMIPFWAWVREPAAPPATAGPGALARAGRSLLATFRSLRGRRSLAAFLAASMLYRDALGALYAFGGVYAVLVLGWSVPQIGAFGVIGAVAAALCSWIGGRLDGAYGPKPVIIGCALALTATCALLAATSREAMLGLPLPPGSPLPDLALYALGAVIGGAGGALQAASRTLMARHAAPARPAEAFGLYALSGKATAFLAPALIGAVTWATGAPRLGLLPLIALFLAGLALLRWVDPEGEPGWSEPSPA